jgi:outer membrane protein TolC
MTFKRCASVVLVWLAGSSAAMAQTPVTLSDVVARALQHSPDVLRLDRDLAVRLADAVDAETRANPEMEVLGRLSDAGDGAGVEVELSQPIRLSDFKLRPLYATALRQAGTLEQEAGLFDLVNRVTELYVAHWAAQAREDLARRAAAEASDITAEIERIRTQQQLPTVQFNVFEPEALLRREDATLHAAERAALEARLALEIGGDGGLLRTADPLLATLPPLDAVLTFASANDFGARLARGRITVNEARLAVAEKDRLPAITPRANYEVEPGGNARAWGVGVAVEIPLWDVNAAEIARARAALQESRMHLAQLNGGAREALIAGLYRQATLLDSRAESFRSKIVPAYRDTYAMVRAMYDQGQTDLLDVWQVQASLLDAEEDAIATVVDALNARIALERAMGGKIEQVN